MQENERNKVNLFYFLQAVQHYRYQVCRGKNPCQWICKTYCIVAEFWNKHIGYKSKAVIGRL